MNKKEKQLIINFLGELSESQSNAGCNDWNFPEDWTEEEKQSFAKEFYEFNGTPEEYEGDYDLADFCVVDVLAEKLKKELDSEVKIESAIDLSKFKKNSLIVAKINPELLDSPAMVESLKRTISDFKTKVDIDDSTHLLITGEDFEVSGFNEDDLNSMGWEKIRIKFV